MINCNINKEEVNMFENKKFNHTYGKLIVMPICML